MLSLDLTFEWEGTVRTDSFGAYSVEQALFMARCQYPETFKGFYVEDIFSLPRGPILKAEVRNAAP
jgi:hypothetical protein